MSYVKLIYHLVFRTKDSRPAIVEAHEDELYKYIWGICKRKGCFLHRIGGMPDHIHMLLEIPPTLAVADFMRDMKTSSHQFLKGNKETFPLFNGWGKSYCALSYSQQDKDMIKEYIIKQKEHHHKVPFTDEIRRLLDECGVVYDKGNFLKE